VETRFRLPADQIDMLIAAGRDGLKSNSSFRAFLTSLGPTPGRSAPAAAAPPAGPPPVSAQEAHVPPQAQAQ
jgi:hypothetical protein